MSENDRQSAATKQEDEDLAYGGICPVCGDEFTDGFDDLREGQSREDVRVCVVDLEDGEAEALFHLPKDQTDRDPLPAHFVAAEIKGVQFTGPARTFETDAEDILEKVKDADGVDNPRVVSYE